MNFTNLIFWSVTIISGMVGTYHIDVVQKTIWRAQAKLIYQSRTQTWGTPKVLVPYTNTGNARLESRLSEGAKIGNQRMDGKRL